MLPGFKLSNEWTAVPKALGKQPFRVRPSQVVSEKKHASCNAGKSKTAQTITIITSHSYSCQNWLHDAAFVYAKRGDISATVTI